MKGLKIKDKTLLEVSFFEDFKVEKKIRLELKFQDLNGNL